MDSFVHIYCLYSTYLDTLFCNLTFLQTFFSSLDAYLRLRNPKFYLTSARRKPALWLKIGSPWLVAVVQAVGQLALSDKQQVRLHRGTEQSVHPGTKLGLHVTCLLPDPNFLIIRTVIAYALPLLACIVLVGLQLRCLRRLRSYPADALQSLLKVRKPFMFETDCRQNNSAFNSVNPFSVLSRQSRQCDEATSAFASEVNVPLSGLRIDPNSDVDRSAAAAFTLVPFSSRYLYHSLTNREYTRQNMTRNHSLTVGHNSVANVDQPNDSANVPTCQACMPHMLLPSNALLELHPIDPRTNHNFMHTSFYECPAHGLINVSIDEGLLSGAEVSTPQTNTDVLHQRSKTDSNSTSTHPLAQPGTDFMSNHSEVHKEVEIASMDRNNSEVIYTTLSQPAPNFPTDAVSAETEQSRLSPKTRGVKEQRRQNCTALHSQPKDEVMQECLFPFTPLWLTAYNGEQLAVAINLVSCIIAVGTWSPYILSTLAHGLCQPIPLTSVVRDLNPTILMFPELTAALDSQLPRQVSRCLIQVTANRIADFRWWAYASSGLLLPCLLFFLDLGLRDGCWKSLNYDRKPDVSKSAVHSKLQVLSPVNRVETYRCQNTAVTNHSIVDRDARIPIQTHASGPLWNERKCTTSHSSVHINSIEEGAA
ncbi:unnamed protein product [Dicrocoelium dendriticum]|nr:unnamed protein product [Dicrocoelium dendriticum]